MAHVQKDGEANGRHQVGEELPYKGQYKHNSLGALILCNLLSANFQDLFLEVNVPPVEFDCLYVFKRFRGDIHSLLLQLLLLMSDALNLFVEIAIKFVTDDHEGEADRKRPSHCHEQSNGAIKDPNRSQDKTGCFVAKPNDPIGCSNDRVDLAGLVVFTCGSCESEHFPLNQSFQALGRLKSRVHVVIKAVHIEHMHEDVQENEQADQSEPVHEVIVILVLHVFDDLSNDHWETHMNKLVDDAAQESKNESTLERNHNCKEDVLVLLSIEHLLDPQYLLLDVIIFSQTAEILKLQVTRLRFLQKRKKNQHVAIANIHSFTYLNNLEDPTEEQLVIPRRLAYHGLLRAHINQLLVAKIMMLLDKLGIILVGVVGHIVSVVRCRVRRLLRRLGWRAAGLFEADRLLREQWRRLLLRLVFFLF